MAVFAGATFVGPAIVSPTPHAHHLVAADNVKGPDHWRFYHAVSPWMAVDSLVINDL